MADFISRRSFLASILAASVAPAIVRAEWIMKGSGIIVPTNKLILPNAIYIDALARGMGNGLSWQDAFVSMDKAFEIFGNELTISSIYIRNTNLGSLEGLHNFVISNKEVKSERS